MSFSTAAVVSYRLGGSDGVSVEAAKWIAALQQLGLAVRTVAGSGTADVIVEGLEAWTAIPPDTSALRRALDGADLVVAENICSLPLNRAAYDAVALAMAGRPAVLHHHDLPWQRPAFDAPVPDDAAWAHVTVNDLSRHQLAERGIRAVTVRNCFDPDPAPGDREAVRAALSIPAHHPLVLQPTRAIPRKNVAGGLALAEALDALYWLTGATEEGYEAELAALLAGREGRVVRGDAFAREDGGHHPVEDMAGAYAAADVVVLPSWWEGFGNPAVEGSLYGRPVVVGPYQVADELRALGFRWLGLGDVDAVERRLASPDPAETAHNRDVARRYLSLWDLPARLAPVLEELSARGDRGRSA